MTKGIEHRGGLYRPCAGIILIDSRNHIFAGQRIDRKEPAWQAPQGGIDVDETPIEAALRELEEEIGLGPGDVEILNQTKDWVFYQFPGEVAASRWNGKYLGQAQKWFLMRLASPETTINLETAHPEFSEWKWMKPSALLNEIIAFKRETYASVLNEFGLI